MKTIIGISNFSFDVQHFDSFKSIQKQLASIKSLQGNFPQHNVSLDIATDILRNKYFGNSLEEQFRNFQFGRDRQVITSYISRLQREYFNGFKKRYSSEDLRSLSKQPNEEGRVCCTLYAPKVLISGFSRIKSIEEFSDFYEYILSKYPIDSNSYFTRLKSHFTNLVYQDDCESTLDLTEGGFQNFTVAFTECLKALNTFSPTVIPGTKEKVKAIKSLTSYGCNPENGSHKNFNFDFDYNGKKYFGLDCQYHLKPSENNQKGDNSFSHKRIYFGFLPIDEVSGEKKWVIAVAAIGPHINNGPGERYAKPKVKRKKTKRKGNS